MTAALASYVRILGRGANLSRSLTDVEAEEAMEIILKGEAAPEAVGALLLLLRMKGETAEEIAGFVRAARAHIRAEGTVALDWPSYAAGRTRGLPWFLLSAKLVAGAGYPVLLHGWNSHQNPIASVRAALPMLNIPVIETPEFGTLAQGIGYLPLETLSAPLFKVLNLRDVLGVRSCINTVLRVLNPTGAAASVQGVFHPPYRELQMDAAMLLKQPSMTVLKGGGGEFERNPAKDIALFGLRYGQTWTDTATARANTHTRLAEGVEASDPSALPALWTGALDDGFALNIVLGTADLALQTLGATETAADLWAQRNRTL
ncbi:glycosyl transferase family 3 [Aestuarium zhoushanense]|jgi:anthranilate phosphoribosyltransferase|nr:glycosyl transferase family 3 [Aestuarium zhoushanense]